MTSVHNRLRIESLLLILFLIPLAVLAYLGFSSRYIADDYCTTAVALSKGIFGSVAQWYTTWAGQYSNFAVKGLIAYAGTSITAFLPALILVSWVGVLIWAILPIVRRLNVQHPLRVATLFASLIVVSIFTGVPSIVQSLYWFAASVPYTIPCILLTLYAGAFIRIVHRETANRVPVSALAATALFMLVIGGFSEVFTAFLITLLILTSMAYWKFAPPAIKRKALWLLVMALLFSLLALAIVVLAPGNAIRQASFTHRLSLPAVFIQTFIVTASYIIMGLGVFSPIPLVLTVSFAMLTGYQLQQNNPHLRLRGGTVRTGMLLATGIGLIVIASTMAPPIYATAVAPPARGYIVAQTALVGMAIGWGLVMGFGARPRPVQSGKPERLVQLLTVIVVCGALLITLRSAADIPNFRVYANEWDSRDQTIRSAVAQHIKTLTVKTLTVDLGEREGLDIIETDPSAWVNQCAATVYGLEQITAQPLETASK